MGAQDGFLKHKRELPQNDDPKNRIKNFKEFSGDFTEEGKQNQAARCMDCGIPFCHSGCPLGNNIPDFNDAVYKQDWFKAFEILSDTNNFPEFTGRICPAPCEASCVLGIDNSPVTIEYIEKSIAEKAYELNYIKPKTDIIRTGKRIAIVGSGPAGLAAADQLNKAGHQVTVFERDDHVGGLLRYGIPDFKLEKSVIERRVQIMIEEGVVFRTNAWVGRDISVEDILMNYDAQLLCCGSTVPRNLPIDGRHLNGIHFAMDFLKQQNKRVSDIDFDQKEISSKGKRVVVIGGGDTGSDCIGTSHRQGAKSVTQIELLPKPPNSRNETNPWPEWPMVMRTSSSQEEGGKRDWALMTKEFIDDGQGNVAGIKVVEIEWNTDMRGFEEKPETEKIIPCDVVYLAMGFVHPEPSIIDQMTLDKEANGVVSSSGYASSVPGVFVAGDMRRGQSLVVWAISEGREAAREVDEYLMGVSYLPSKEKSFYNI